MPHDKSDLEDQINTIKKALGKRLSLTSLFGEWAITLIIDTAAMITLIIDKISSKLKELT